VAPRVAVFIDYQNVHLTAHDTFWPYGTPRRKTHIDPLRLGQLLVGRRQGGGALIDVRVYRGKPSAALQPDAAAANDRQAAAWSRDPLVTVRRRLLRYPKEWPKAPAQEKGIDVALAVDFVRLATERRYDVGILVSRDTDLIPCLETVVDLRLAHVEVASWEGSGRLRFPGGNRPWCHYLYKADYRAVLDPIDYSLSP
jgi:uncharacterized LabA/DUF88 family protein